MILQGTESLGTWPDTVRVSREKMWWDVDVFALSIPIALTSKKETTNCLIFISAIFILISRPIYSFLLSCFYSELVPYLLLFLHFVFSFNLFYLHCDVLLRCFIYLFCFYFVLFLLLFFSYYIFLHFVIVFTSFPDCSFCSSFIQVGLPACLFAC